MRHRLALLLLATAALHVEAQTFDDLFPPKNPDAETFTAASSAVALALTGDIGSNVVSCSFLKGSAQERALALVGVCFMFKDSPSTLRDRLNTSLPAILRGIDQTALRGPQPLKWNPGRLEISRAGQAATFIQFRPDGAARTTRVIVASRRMYESALQPSPGTSPALKAYLPPEEQTFGRLTVGAWYLPSDASGSWMKLFESDRQGARLTLKRAGKVGVFNLDSTQGTVNGKAVTLNARPFISQRFIYLPESALKLMGCTVTRASSSAQGTTNAVQCGAQTLKGQLISFQ